MGIKESKELQKEIHISEDQLIDPSDTRLFPKAVRDELLTFKGRVPEGQIVFVQEFNESSTFVQWLRQTKSFFDFNVSNNENESPSPKNNSVNRNKNPFLDKLSTMCQPSPIPLKFLANLLETANRFLFAFLHTGHIAGFLVFGKDDDLSRRCLHRYVTCTGPRRLKIGSALVNSLHEIAKREGYTCVTLGAVDSLEFHSQMGYVPTKKRTIEGPEYIFQIKGGKQRKRKTRKHRK